MIMEILIGSTFPISLIRRKVTIEPSDICELRRKAAISQIFSFWGHDNTVSAAGTLLGFDVTPKSQRPALVLNSEFLPELEGHIFTECWVVSPDYIAGFRPEIGSEVSSGKIIGWQILKMTWSRSND